MTAAEVEVRTVDGDTVRGALLELSTSNVVLERDSERTSIDAQKMLTLTPVSVTLPGGETAGPPQRAVELILADGSIVVGNDYVSRQRSATLSVGDKDSLSFDLRDVTVVRLQPTETALEKAWQEIVGGKHTEDLLVIRKGDTLDYHKGLVGDISETSVEFELDGEKVSVKRSRVYGIVYYRAARDLPGALCTIFARDGSKWAARTLSFDGRIVWTTPCGIEVTRPLQAVDRIDFSAGKIVFLSDLQPESVRWTPFFAPSQPLPAVEEFYSPRNDRSFSGGAIRLRGRKYDKGLAIHSRTEMVYRLPGRFSRLRAEAGIDDEVAPNGHVQLIIRADDRELFNEMISGADPVKPIDLDISGAKRLTIIVDFGEKLDVADHLVLALARISK